MAHTLLLIRHAKSDWDVAASDRDRPLAPRGKRQAPHTGRWIADHGLIPDLSIVSPAARTRATWELVARKWTGPVVAMRLDEAAYTFSASDLLPFVRDAAESVAVLALTGHNPALEELVTALTGRSARMPTSALAVIELDSWADAGRRRARLQYAGRPADR